jgi:hypothetical protein
MANDRRTPGQDRRQRERRARLDAIQTRHDELRAIIELNIRQIQKLEQEQTIQLIRIGQIQKEIDELKKTR